MSRRVLRTLLHFLLKLTHHPIDIFSRAHSRSSEVHPGAAPPMDPQRSAAHDQDHEQKNTRATKQIIRLRSHAGDQRAEDQSADQSAPVASVVDARRERSEKN